MKKWKFLLIAVLVFAMNTSSAQDNNSNTETKKEKQIIPCERCESSDLRLLIYDAKCRCFRYQKPGGPIKPLKDLREFSLYYKRPFQLKIENLNRYLYDVNLGNSDVTFTSNQSEIMQQYLLRGSSNQPPQVPNTHTDGASGSQGDQIFALLSSFKPEIDRLFTLLGDIHFSANEQTRKAEKAIKAQNELSVSIKKENVTIDKKLARNKTLLPEEKELQKLNLYNKELDVYADSLTKIKSAINSSGSFETKNYIYKTYYVPKYNSFKEKAISIVGEIERGTNKSYIKLRNSSNFSDFRKETLALGEIPDNLLISIGPNKPASATASIPAPVNSDTSIVRSDTTIKKFANNLSDAFGKLEDYYNSFIDDKITAYSLCTDSFACCNSKDTSKLTYYHFNELLSNINIAYGFFREAIFNIKEPDVLPAKSPGDTPPKKATATPATLPEIMKITAGDFSFDKEGKIIGIRLTQSGDAAKPKVEIKTSSDLDKIKEKVDSLGKLWYAFEKSVSPEFIMRRILFRRNLVEENMRYLSPPIYAYGDRMRLVFNIVASDSAKKNGVILDDMTTESLDLRVRGKARFSFSAGTFVALGDKMRNATFEFRQVPAQGTNVVDATSPYRLLPTGKGSIPIGASALANITGSVSEGFYLGGSVGAGLTVAPDLKVGFMAGLTASIGNYHQFHFTAGIIGLTVDELKENYKGSTVTYTTVPSGGVYNQRVKPGLFLSVSYTVFNVKATSNKKDGLINKTGIIVN